MDLEVCAKQGAVWLDQVSPGWAEVIDLDDLNMESPVSCVLGQMYGGRYGHGILALAEELGVDVYADDGNADPRKCDEVAVGGGFNAPYDAVDPEATFDRLNEAWMHLIGERKVEHDE